MKKNIIAANPGGLSNRIKCLISMWRISEKSDIEMYLYWNQNDRCGAEFHKLFENDFNIISEEELENMENKVVSETHRLIVLGDEIPDGFAKVFPTPRGNNIDFEFNRIPNDVRINICNYLNELKPIEIIRSIVNNFATKNDVENLVGIHIRRGDFLDGKEGLGKVSSDDKFIKKMKELLIDEPSTKFFLCTDCQFTEDKFKEIFKDKIIIYPKKKRDRQSTIATQQGLVDLLLLARTKHIIGTYRSTYNEVAWYLGNCKAKVTIIIDDDLNRQYENKKDKMRKSKYLKLKKFIYDITQKFRMFKN